MVYGREQSKASLVCVTPQFGGVIVIGAYEAPVELFTGVCIVAKGLDYRLVDGVTIRSVSTGVPALPVALHVRSSLTKKPPLVCLLGDDGFEKLRQATLRHRSN